MAINSVDISKIDNTGGKSKESKSPYHNNDRVHLLSKSTDCRPYRKLENVHKANSDELKVMKRKKKKMKKSVLTLSNERAVIPQTITTSDMNDSEYFNRSCDSGKQNKKIKIRKLMRQKPMKNNEFENKDASYRSQANVGLDCSSTNIIKYFKGDGKKISKPSQKTDTNKFKAHDVWSMLRNINRFQFRQSPPESEESFVTTKTARRIFTSRDSYKSNSRVCESWHAEEVAYMSNIEVDKNSFNPIVSQAYVSVIDDYKDANGISKQVGKPAYSKYTKPQKISSQRQKKTILNDSKAISQMNEENQKLEVKQIAQLNVVEKGFNKTYSESCSESTIVTKNTNHTSWNYCNITSGKSSKALMDEAHKKDSITSRKLLYPKQSKKQMIGNTKAILDKDSYSRLALSKKISVVTTMPSTTRMPKLTLTEIRRRLSKLKYPLVILGKDQLSSTVHVADYEPPQFMGLDKQIWPFMESWYKINVTSEYQNIKNNLIQANKATKKDTIQVSKKKPESKKCKAWNQQDSSCVKTQLQKFKPIYLLKDRLKQLLTKKPAVCTVVENKDMIYYEYISENDDENSILQNDTIHNEKKKFKKSIDITTGTNMNSKAIKSHLQLAENNSVEFLNKKSSCNIKYKQQKSKWAEDFIEAILSKIKNGIYYSLDSRDISQATTTIDVSLQTSLENIYKYEQFGESSELKPLFASSTSFNQIHSHSSKIIPGFEEALPELEIKLFNKDEITIKQRMTNVVLQFNVRNSFDSEYFSIDVEKTLSFLTPVYESTTKVFKCNKTLRNAILPAEICSLVPKIMKHLIESHSDLYLTKQVLDTAQIPVISQGSRQVVMPSAIKYLLYGGHFRNVESKIMNTIPKLYLATYKSLVIDVLISNKSLLEIKLNPNDLILLPEFVEVSNATITNVPLTNVIPTYCTTIQRYDFKSRQLTPSYPRLDIVQMARRWLYLKCNLNFCIIYSTPSNKIVNFMFKNDFECVDIKVFNLPIFSLITTNTIKVKQNSCNVHNEYKQTDANVFCNNSNSKSQKKSQKNYPRTSYRKCKLASSISIEDTMPLANILNLEDFFEILGCSNDMWHVFEGYKSSLILSCILEMKSWISDISPQQAMLILLLTNKKETQNLLRFRPVLIQGIAVKRITTASELDMEIEVIETENMNRFIRFEDISYPPASVENQDNLFEELYWIAKTTAADFNRTFDESSEKLLQNLLYKRKKLNASYLRVMARYVGLGLLKPPSNLV